MRDRVDPRCADLILFNGRIHTLDVSRPVVSAVAVQAGMIIYTGGDAEALTHLAHCAPENTVDLKQACVIPGLTDAHLHFEWFSLGLQQVNAETKTLDAALAEVKKQTAGLQPGQWVTGTGWNHNAWGGVFPSASDLDRVSPANPVALDAKSKHAAWVNTRALQLAGISASTADPPGGKIVRDAIGAPTGILLESAVQLVKRAIPEPGVEDVVEAMRNGQRVAHQHGLTGVHCMDGASALQAFQVLHGKSELTLRVVKSIPLENLDAALKLGIRTGLGNDWLRIGGVKMFSDGALGPRSAWMLAGYDSEPGNLGISTTPVEVLREAVLRANRGGLSTNIHAIGDRANREVLNIYAQVANELGNTGLRNRIEHVQLLHPQDYRRLAELGVIASMQPLHATSDMLMADRDWGARAAGSYALKTQLDNGAMLALGSDCPVETLDPLAGIHAAVTRRRADGSPGPEGWYPEQRLTVEEAVRGYTVGPAFAAQMENRLGVISKGMLADMTILENDIFTIDPMEIRTVKVLGTVTGGGFAWRSETL